MTFDEFAQLLAVELDVAREQLTQSARCHDDLGLDSLQMIEVTFVLEDLSVDVNEDWVWACETIGDIYGYYIAARTEDGVHQPSSSAGLDP